MKNMFGTNPACSSALSGRNNPPSIPTQAIGRVASGLGYARSAFQAVPVQPHLS